MIAFRLPSSSKQHFYLGNWTTNEKSTESFVVVPFDSKQKAYYSPLDTPVSKHTFFNKEFFFANDQPYVASKEEYLNYTSKAIQQLKRGSAQKIVTSRIVASSHKMTMESIFDRLCENYTDAFVYMCSGPFGTWCGASPEILLTSEKTAFTTVSLAGTQLYEDEHDYYWGQKEKEEQQLVTDYIAKTIEKLGLEYTKGQPKTIRAGNVVHLKSLFKGELKFPEYAKTLVEKLHPTPAVCGLPPEEAKSFILDNELHNRLYYTGYLGLLGKEEVKTFVNLRCMQLFPKQAFIYVGGGITAESSVNDEYEETENKSQVMKSVLKP